VEDEVVNPYKMTGKTITSYNLVFRVLDEIHEGKIL
jgi:hypothetical protein